MRLEAVQSSERAGAPGRAVNQDAHLRALVDGVLGRVARAARLADVADGDVRGMMRLTCDAAHARGLRAEQLLLLLKEAWQELPEAHRVPRHDANDVLARAITVCIHEYYAR